MRALRASVQQIEVKHYYPKFEHLIVPKLNFSGIIHEWHDGRPMVHA